METPHHAAISTALPLVDGGPRKLVHGVFSTVMREKWALPEVPTLPEAVAERWREQWGEEVVAAAARLDRDAAADRPDRRAAAGAGGDQPDARPSPPAARHRGGGACRLWRGQMVGAGHLRPLCRPAARAGRGADGARSVRGAGRQDHAARHRRLGGDRGRRLAKSSGATFRKSGAHRPRGRRSSPPTS